VLLCVAAAESVVLLLHYGSGLTFYQDEWDVILHRRGLGLGSFLTPDNEHIFVIPSAIYKLLLATFGMTSTMPFRVVATMLLVATAVLLFAFLRSRVGDWLAPFAAVLVLFLGPAWQTLLLPVEMARVGSTAAGIGMLLALRRRDRAGDLWACGLATVSVLFFSLGVSFVLAAAVDVAQRRSEWRRRIFIPAIPLAVYALWYVSYGHAATSNVSLHNIVHSPIYLLNALAAGFQSLFGLIPGDVLQLAHPTWGWAILAAVVVAIAMRLLRGGRVGDQLWPVVVAAASALLLAGIAYVPGREATESRFQYTAVIFSLLVLAELLAGVRPSRVVLWGAAAVSGLALAANLSTLSLGRDYMREQSDLTRADLGALEIASHTVANDFVLAPDISGTRFLNAVDAGPYLSAVRAFGSPADSQAELAAAASTDRAWADTVLARALPVSLTPSSDARAQGRCANARPDFELRPGTSTVIRLRRGPSATVRLGRFALPSHPVVAGTLDGGRGGVLSIPADTSVRPWHLAVRAGAPATVCSAGQRLSHR
jgi:hypothetical protein